MPFLNVVPPNLPLASDGYDRMQQDQILNALRLYFTRLNGDLSGLAKGLGASQLNIPTALYYSTAIQTAAAIDTAYAITYNQTYYQNGLELDSSDTDSKITATKPGIYNFQLSAQLLSSNSSAKELQAWVRKNGTDIGYSSRIYTVDTNNHHVPLAWNFNIDLAADDYIQMMWGTSDTDLELNSGSASSPYPGHASAVLTVNFVSNLEGFDIATAP